MINNTIKQNKQKVSVFLKKCSDYSENNITTAIESTFDAFPHIKTLFQAKCKVLLKPNLLIGKPADACVTTHPILVRVVAKLLIDLGAKVLIGDSPSVGSTRKAMLKSGIAAALSDLPVQIVDFNESVRLSAPKGRTFRTIDVAKVVTQVDYIINLPKIKTHGQMVMTLAVKNLFGCIVGMRKQEWHLKAGSSHEFFAEMLVELMSLIKPTFTIVDGIRGMEGNGPQNGTPRDIGFITAGTDPVAIDRVILECLGIEPSIVMTNNAARKHNLGQTDLDLIEILGDSIEKCRVKRFFLPGINSLIGNRLPLFLVHYLKRIFTEKPVINHRECKLCLSCINICPAKAMSVVNNTVAINEQMCIHCFCCQETCPDSAITIKAGLGNRVVVQRFS